MLKVIIVDDEQFIAQGLQALIDWNAAGYEVAAVLSDGQEALEYIKKSPVDLVITDVMMPKMTGLELLETVRRENLSNAGFVILSGYSEFSYAQKRCATGVSTIFSNRWKSKICYPFSANTITSRKTAKWRSSTNWPIRPGV